MSLQTSGEGDLDVTQMKSLVHKDIKTFIIAAFHMFKKLEV